MEVEVVVDVVVDVEVDVIVEVEVGDVDKEVLLNKFGCEFTVFMGCERFL